MKLTCPYCNSKFSIDESARSETLVNLTQSMDKFGAERDLVWEYSGAFATRYLGPVAPAKRLRIVTELLRLWETGIFQVQGKRYKIARAGIVEGMLTVCNAEKFGFKNHNYLKRILMTDGERVSAEGLTAKDEKRLDEGRRTRDESVEVETLSPEAQAKFKKKLGINKFSDLLHMEKK